MADIHVLNVELTSRDAKLVELRRGTNVLVPLKDILAAAPSEPVASGGYESLQGPTITPMPLWMVEVKTFERNVGGELQVSPWLSGDLIGLVTARTAQKVRGTGSEKEKWRKTRMDAPVEPRYIFGIGTSTWLLPFAIGHRSLACLPASIDVDNARLRVHHELVKKSSGSLRDFSGAEGGPSNAIRNWTREAQKAWLLNKKEGGYDEVTKYLDYGGKLRKVKPEALRVIHTRSRKFYAAFLDPSADTALGVPFAEIQLKTRRDGRPGRATNHPLGGVAVDNKVHYVEVASPEEGHWMAAVFNSDLFSSMVMKRSKGEPPNIYSIPAQVLADLGLIFDPASTKHQKVARLGQSLARAMAEKVRSHYLDEKGFDIDALDDTDASPEVPPLTMGKKFRDFLVSLDEWHELNEAVAQILDGVENR
jgi:hypothetical protein